MINQPGFYNSAQVVTPHASDPLPNVSEAIIVDVTGVVALLTERGDGTDVLITMTAGTIYPIRATHIRAIGTTATGIIALYNT